MEHKFSKDSFYLNFRRLLKFKINSFEAEGSDNPWRNIFHVTKGQNEDRYPALFLHQDGHFLVATDGFSKNTDQVQLDQDDDLELPNEQAVQGQTPERARGGRGTAKEEIGRRE